MTMICTYHFIQIIDVSSESVIRLMSEDFQTDIDDFKAFFRSRQADLEACSVELQNGDVYFWSRYNIGTVDQHGINKNGWEYLGKAAMYGPINMTHTKALLASTIPADRVYLDLELATEYYSANWRSFSFTVKK